MAEPLRVLLTLAAAGCLLAGCANPQAEQAARAQTSLIGMPRQMLLSCAGVPDRSASADGTDFHTYVSRSASAGYGGPTTSIGIGGGSSSGVGGGIGFGIPLGGGTAAPPCEATFTVQNGVVTRLTYSDGPGSAACYPVVRNCLALTPPPK
jgi:hypothetical protein